MSRVFLNYIYRKSKAERSVRTAGESINGRKLTMVMSLSLRMKRLGKE